MENQQFQTTIRTKECVECGIIMEETYETYLYECERCMNERE
jgi:hypothetical protein